MRTKGRKSPLNFEYKFIVVKPFVMSSSIQILFYVVYYPNLHSPEGNPKEDSVVVVCLEVQISAVGM